MSPVVPGLMSSCGCSRVFVVSSGVFASLFGLMERSISGIASSAVPLCLELPLCHRLVGFFVVIDFYLCPLL